LSTKEEMRVKVEETRRIRNGLKIEILLIVRGKGERMKAKNY